MPMRAWKCCACTWHGASWTPDDFDLPALAAASNGFSGAEIEQAIVAALYTAHAEQKPLDTDLLMHEIRGTRPLSVLMAEQVPPCAPGHASARCRRTECASTACAGHFAGLAATLHEALRLDRAMFAGEVQAAHGLAPSPPPKARPIARPEAGIAAQHPRIGRPVHACLARIAARGGDPGEHALEVAQPRPRPAASACPAPVRRRADHR
jgi:hypothetical protein